MASSHSDSQQELESGTRERERERERERSVGRSGKAHSAPGRLLEAEKIQTRRERGAAAFVDLPRFVRTIL